MKLKTARAGDTSQGALSQYVTLSPLKLVYSLSAVLRRGRKMIFFMQIAGGKAGYLHFYG